MELKLERTNEASAKVPQMTNSVRTDREPERFVGLIECEEFFLSFQIRFRSRAGLEASTDT